MPRSWKTDWRRSRATSIDRSGVAPSRRPSRNTVLGRISTSTHVKAHAGSDLVVESAVERFEIKAEIFRQLDGSCPDDDDPRIQHILDLHHPPGDVHPPTRTSRRHALHESGADDEARRGDSRSRYRPETVEIVNEVARAMGKTPVECGDHPGFVSNRLFMPMINEAVFAVAENVATPEAVDEIMTLGMNHPMGPLALADLIGLDNCLSVMQTLHAELGDPKYRPCPLLIRMVDAGRLGRKTGRGFYTYPED